MPLPRIVFPLLAGSALQVGGCKHETVTSNPPEPVVTPPADPPAPQPLITMNPPAPGLPSFEEVESDHPPGATNPPIPVLLVLEDESRCWKGWVNPRAMDKQALEYGGRILTDPAQAEGNTEVQCPDNAPAVVAAWRAGQPKAE